MKKYLRVAKAFKEVQSLGCCYPPIPFIPTH